MRPFSLQLHYHWNQTLFKGIHGQALPPIFLLMRTLSPYSVPRISFLKIPVCLSLSWSERERRSLATPASSFNQKHSFWIWPSKTVLPLLNQAEWKIPAFCKCCSYSQKFSMIAGDVWCCLITWHFPKLSLWPKNMSTKSKATSSPCIQAPTRVEIWLLAKQLSRQCGFAKWDSDLIMNSPIRLFDPTLLD